MLITQYVSGMLKPVKLLQTVDSHRAGVFSLAVSRDGKHALSGSADGTIRLWKLEPSSTPSKPVPAAMDAQRSLEATTPKEFLVEALIDGDSKLHIKPTGIYWENGEAAKPGHHDGQNEPTYVNGKPWQPVWANPDEEKGYDKSDLFALPIGQIDLDFKLVAVTERRGETGIDERSPVTMRTENGEQILLIPDEEDGDRWYTIRLFHKKATVVAPTPEGQNATSTQSHRENVTSAQSQPRGDHQVWEWHVRGKPPSKLTFYADGSVNNNPNITWTKAGNKVTVRWPEGWVDTMMVSPNGRSMVGGNQHGARITARFLSE